MIKYQKESFTGIKDEVAPLLWKHYKEVSAYQDIKLNPDWESYKQIEDLGALTTYTARKDGKIIGYAVYFLKNHIHYKDSFQAVQDIIFIDKKERGFGRDFIAWCDVQLKEMGVQAVYHHVKEAHNWGHVLLEQGYKKVESVYGRRLDEWQ